MTSRDYSLAGKSAVVTGAGNGIGRAIALAFAQAEANVACVDIDAKAAEATAATAANESVKALAVRCDVADEADIEAAAKAIRRNFPQSIFWSMAPLATIRTARCLISRCRVYLP
jgi:NAD(P)-dependent dehydrogenase (short-subunit alcohol dehydrogenase family)